ncbi:hypothetical protein EMPS_08513 [Entomortierella parvispora]|uniref:Glutathione S-transferase n=1 Tax=Entomortierella parvispora TaxID=205924 RepID=A0A9P3HG91_9FUNG|nr:hypothetical protein EMPS_08513 [Entomortierella parvispora]
MVHQFFDPANAAAFNTLADKTDSKFEVHYFGLHGLSGTIRTILAVSGAKFVSIAPAEGTWVPKYKPHTPFGVLPNLRETSADGTLVVNITESDAIERYLSRKFGYLGKTAHEELLVSQFVAANNAMMTTLVKDYIAQRENLELKAANKEKLIATTIPTWIEYHEKHLSENPAAKEGKHGNGHYVGNSLSLADLKAYQLIGILQDMIGDDLINKEKTPALLKVKETVEAIPSLQAWKATEDYKAMSERNFQALGFH